MESHMHGMSAHGQARPGPQPVKQPQGPAPVAPMPVMKSERLELEPIGLVDDITTPQTDGAKNIRAFGVGEAGPRRSKWTRETLQTGAGACRVRTFRGKLSDQGLEYLDNAINEWLDENTDVEVKFVTSTVGTFEGKMREPALVLNLWY